MRVINPNRNFTIVSNEIYQHGLSLKAIGLYGYICSKPDGWDFSVSGTASQVEEGKDAIRSAISELEEKGFLRRRQVRKSDGLMGESIWEVLNSPSDYPSSDKPTSVRPRLSNTILNKTREREDSTLSELIFSSEEVESLSKQHGVTAQALAKSGVKYRNFCQDRGRKMSKPGFMLWLTREKWEDDDFSPERMAAEFMKGF